MEDSGKKKSLIPWIILFVIAFIAAAYLFILHYFSELNTQLFEERKSHLIEVADKVSEVIDSVGNESWVRVQALEHTVSRENIPTQERLMELLGSTETFVDMQNSLALLMDEDGKYYSSDGQKGYWTASGLLSFDTEDRQQSMVEIPHIPGKVYYLFLARLDKPVLFGPEGKQLTHAAVAVDIDSLRSRMSVSGFGNECYSYIINQEGRRLYEYTYEENFIGGYNILRALAGYPIVNGDSYEALGDVLGGGESVAIEFEYQNDAGQKRRWFVANAAMESTGWQVLLFVPTDVLGAHTTRMLNQTMRFFGVMALMLILMFTVILFILIMRRSDKKMMAKQEKMNAALAEAAQEAQSASKAKSEFLSYMSHDIRTPINGIVGMTEIAMRSIDDKARVLECLEKVQDSSGHLLNLVNDVLTMSRIESGKTEVGHSPFDIRVCLANCASIVEGQLADREIRFVREFEEMEHPFVIGDELHLRQIFINILGNAIKFTRDGGSIFFRAREEEGAEGMALFCFEMEDSGIGMSQEFLPHIFDAFMQEDGGTRTNYKGTGLGMAITKKFVDLLGGTIEVESKLDVGSKFTVKLPMEIDSGHPEEISGAPALEVDLGGMKVLLVEDNELNMEIAQVILETEGIVVTTAQNGKAALDLFEGNPPGTFDLILMDIMMPVMDGITAAKKIRQSAHPQAKDIPILAMTANAFEEDVKKTKEAGMDAHLSKPIEPDLLFETLKTFYSKR